MLFVCVYAQLYEPIHKAHAIQKKRGIYNGLLTPAQISQYCTLTPDAHTHIQKAFSALNLTMRSYHKLLRVARTIADLQQSPDIESKHISEALTYRTLDQTLSKI